MRFANVSAASYCGIDLHARTMYLCVLDRQGAARLHKNYPAPTAFLLWYPSAATNAHFSCNTTPDPFLFRTAGRGQECVKCRAASAR